LFLALVVESDVSEYVESFFADDTAMRAERSGTVKGAN
jgi:hypothetical protein